MQPFKGKSMNEKEFLEELLSKNNKEILKLSNQLSKITDLKKIAEINSKISFYEQDNNSILISLNGYE